MYINLKGKLYVFRIRFWNIKTLHHEIIYFIKKILLKQAEIDSLQNKKIKLKFKCKMI